MHKKYVFVFLTTAFGVIFTYILGLIICVKILSLPILANAEIWLKNTYKIKDYINAQPTQKQRLIIIGDSNSLFGFNSALINVKTKYKPINYATHGGLPLNYHIDKIIDSAKNGDIVLMPLAFGYYTREAPKNDIWYIQNMETWGDGYNKYIDLKDRLLSYFQNPPIKVAKNIIKYIILHNKTSKDIISEMQNKLANQAPCEGKFEGYNYKSLNIFGDFCTQENNGDFVIKSDYGMRQKPKISSFFISEFKRLQTFVESRNIKIILTYPATAKNELFDTVEILENIKALHKQLEALDIKIYGDFRDVNFESKYFYDTNYHLNKSGTILRTEAVIKLLSDLEKSREI